VNRETRLQARSSSAADRDDDGPRVMAGVGRGRTTGGVGGQPRRDTPRRWMSHEGKTPVPCRGPGPRLRGSSLWSRATSARPTTSEDHIVPGRRPCPHVVSLSFSLSFSFSLLISLLASPSRRRRRRGCEAPRDRSFFPRSRLGLFTDEILLACPTIRRLRVRAGMFFLILASSRAARGSRVIAGLQRSVKRANDLPRRYPLNFPRVAFRGVRAVIAVCNI